MGLKETVKQEYSEAALRVFEGGSPCYGPKLAMGTLPRSLDCIRTAGCGDAYYQRHDLRRTRGLSADGLEIVYETLAGIRHWL